MNLYCESLLIRAVAAEDAAAFLCKHFLLDKID